MTLLINEVGMQKLTEIIYTASLGRLHTAIDKMTDLIFW
jgi:hypothetical protein